MWEHVRKFAHPIEGVLYINQDSALRVSNSPMPRSDESLDALG